MQEERPVADGVHVGPFDRVNGRSQHLRVTFVGRIARHVDDHPAIDGLDDVQGGDQTAGTADRTGDGRDVRCAVKCDTHGY